MKKGMQKLFGKFGKEFRVADVRGAAKLATLRCEPLEGREMLSTTGLGAAALDGARTSRRHILNLKRSTYPRSKTRPPPSIPASA